MEKTHSAARGRKKILAHTNHRKLGHYGKKTSENPQGDGAFWRTSCMLFSRELEALRTRQHPEPGQGHRARMYVESGAGDSQPSQEFLHASTATSKDIFSILRTRSRILRSRQRGCGNNTHTHTHLAHHLSHLPSVAQRIYFVALTFRSVLLFVSGVDMAEPRASTAYQKKEKMFMQRCHMQPVFTLRWKIGKIVRS